MSREWSNEEIEFLINNAETMNASELGKSLDRTRSEIIYKCSSIGLKPLVKNPNTSLVGKKFGKLTVLYRTNRTDPKKIHAYYLCKCDCGEFVEISSKSLHKNGRKSCRCLVKEYKIEKLPPGESSLNGLYLTYKLNAKRRGFELNISKEEFRILTKMNCYYCGCEPYQKYQQKGTHSGYIYNGIDRIRNDIGYDLDNCIPACGICNRMRMNMDQDQFIEKIYEISKNLNLCGG